jgi:hypothetical protein
MTPHQLYQQSGRLRVRMEDGIEVEAGNAETTAVPRTRRLGHGRRTGGDRTRDDQTIASLNHRRSPSLQAERLRALGAAVPAPAPTCGPGRGPDAPTGRVHHTRRSVVTVQAPSANLQIAIGPHRGDRPGDESLRQAVLLQGGSGSGGCSRVAGRRLRARRPAGCPAGA